MNRKTILPLVCLFLLCISVLQAQERQISLEGTHFTIGELLDEIENQTDITIVNRGAALNRTEVLGTPTTSPEMVRNVVDQLLSGTAYVYNSSAAYTVINVERTAENGDRLLEQVYVDAITGRVVSVTDVLGRNSSPIETGMVFDQMLLNQVFSGRSYTYSSSGTYTIITVTVTDAQGNRTQRLIAVDMATGQEVPLNQVIRAQTVIPAGAAPAQAQMFDTYTFPGIEYLPRFALKTNLLYGATLTPNLGFEVLLSRNLTLDVSGGLNPWTFKDNKKFKHWMVQPTLRYWIQEPFNGHFIGGSLMYTSFNAGGIDLPGNILNGLANYRYRGDGYAVSFQYGHNWILSPRWAIEASINVGYMYLDYRKYDCGWCGELIGPEKKHYLGPTNASISLIYIIR